MSFADFSIGKTLAEIKADGGNNYENAFAAAVEPLSKIVVLLQENKGPFFDGDQPGFVDFVFAGFLRFFDIQDQLTGVLDAAEKGQRGGRKSCEDLYKACGKWLERDDY